ncbi:hypothetical protein [Tropicibacter naphthalenivorans]|uniref:Cytochrome c domain-containing protein n=1 Tax=Tropicibacter naphthalenivorans TaxID=441103 RepID=A0A0P1GFZ2_9RHOB|nr:hypothetical protein [Tropicibacter naphthalenivorans]CUH80751.1 hypothetical protein TRN7648_03142 [Tropicibacter naphthalenivorans]SMC90005.1 hypothetical protein SAMN04488093_106112 [Tropicibacter naphthalenivorans]
MKHRIPGAICAAIMALPGGLAAQSPSEINPLCDATATKPLTPVEAAKAAQVGHTAGGPQANTQNPYPDFGFMIEPNVYFACFSDQPIFRLKTDFPKDLPSEMPPFWELDPTDPVQALDYLVGVKTYSLTGNAPSWDPFQNAQANWYHIPWLHSSPTAYPPNGGTEGFRGLIKEAPISQGQIGPNQTDQEGNYSVYAITLVNDIAGYTLGQMWADPTNPDPRTTDARYGGGFKDGAVFAKLLFTDAAKDGADIAVLQNPVEWRGYITQNFWTSDKRTVQPLRLVQMDVAVRDSRAGETKWVMGTFAYNGAADPKAQDDATRMQNNLIPVGVQWGNDPDNTEPGYITGFPATETRSNPGLKETVIFDHPDLNPHLPPQHLGWNGRLNGPVDLSTTSCLSCHINAQYPALVSLVPDGAVPDGGTEVPKQAGTDEWMFWFQNTPAAMPTTEAAYSTDFSFQVAISLTNFFAARNALDAGYYADEFRIKPVPIQRGYKD